MIRASLLAAAAMVALVCGVGPISSQDLVDLSVRASAGAFTAALVFAPQALAAPSPQTHAVPRRPARLRVDVAW